MSPSISRPEPGVPPALAALDQAGIAWCVWKGSDHLAGSLAGTGDIDLLVDESVPAESIAAVLAAAGMRRGGAPTSHGPEDWFGAHERTGATLHLQLYRQVEIDDGMVVRWVLRNSRRVLDNRVRHRSGVWVAHPVHEAVLLTLQALARPDTTARRLLRLKTSTGEQLSKRLRALPSTDGMETAAAQLVGTAASNALAALAADPTSDARGALARATVRRALRDLEPSRTDRIVARTRAWRRRLARRLLGRRYRRASRDGLVVAAIGSDGSGKSSIARDLASEYGAKFDAQLVYFGSGDGATLLFLAPFKLGRRVYWTFRPPLSEGSPSHVGHEPGKPRRGPGLASIPWAIALALERSHKARQVARARRRGAVVFCDRYPQVQFPGIHDGPRLGVWLDHGSRTRRALARWEQGRYERVLAVGPDLTLLLDVSQDVAQQRRPEHHPADLARRIDVVRQLRYPGTTEVIDADAPYDEVLSSARRAVTQALS